MFLIEVDEQGVISLRHRMACALHVTMFLGKNDPREFPYAEPGATPIGSVPGKETIEFTVAGNMSVSATHTAPTPVSIVLKHMNGTTRALEIPLGGRIIGTLDCTKKK